MARNKPKFGKCWGCFFPENEYKCAHEWISRRKKKTLHKAYDLFNLIKGDEFRGWLDVSSCSLWSSYKEMRPFIKQLDYFLRYKNAITYLHQVVDELMVLCFDKGNWKLGWYWEDDNGLYSFDGSMPLQYGSDPKDGTWAWSETRRLCEIVGIDILTVKNERHFLQLVSSKLSNI